VILKVSSRLGIKNGSRLLGEAHMMTHMELSLTYSWNPLIIGTILLSIPHPGFKRMRGIIFQKAQIKCPAMSFCKSKRTFSNNLIKNKSTN
jgi:hypothetical protein